MLMNLLYGIPTMVFCLLLQALLVVVALRSYARHRRGTSDASIWKTVVIMCRLMVVLVLGNLGQVAVWAALFRLLGEFDQFGVAMYHSAVNFATLGYGDIVMSEKHRLLGPFEAINGVLMIGISTAALTSAFQDSIKRGRARPSEKHTQ